MAKLKNIGSLIIFIVSISLVVYGQKTVGYQYLGMQVLGLVGLLTLLYLYNKQFK